MNVGLTSGLLATLVTVGAIGLPVLAVALWTRVRGPRPVRVGQRWLLVVASQLVGVLAVLIAINNSFGLYASWDDLLGRSSNDAATISLGAAPAPAAHRPGSWNGSSAGRGTGSGTDGPGPTSVTPMPWSGSAPAGFSVAGGAGTYHATVSVPGSTSALDLYVVLPPEYFMPSYATARFPVVELFHGYPGTPTTWLHALDVRSGLAQARAAGSGPVILVIPSISVAGAPDLECTNLPNQPQIATFLTTGVRTAVTTRFRVRDDRNGWAVMGYSEGGYCAAALLLRHPDLFAAGVDLSGYDAPLSTYFDAYPALRRAGSLSTLLRSRPPVSLLVSASRQDPQSANSLGRWLALVRHPTHVTPVYVSGGHNTSVWSAQLPSAFQWLSQHMRGVIS